MVREAAHPRLKRATDACFRWAILVDLALSSRPASFSDRSDRAWIIIFHADTADAHLARIEIAVRIIDTQRGGRTIVCEAFPSYAGSFLTIAIGIAIVLPAAGDQWGKSNNENTERSNHELTLLFTHHSKAKDDSQMVPDLRCVAALVRQVRRGFHSSPPPSGFCSANAPHTCRFLCSL